MLGKRSGYSDTHGLPYRPHNVTHIVLGTVFLWVGWFGFNGGSALGANMRAVMASSGFVPAWSAVIFGVVGAGACNYATKLKYLIGVDDALDIFGEHGIGGIVGNLLTSFFAADYIAHLDGFTEIPGGWLNRHWIQLAYQLADCVSGFVYSFFGTCIILFVMNLIPGLSLRATEEEEVLGMDDTQLGEFAYDYVELRRETSDVIVGEESSDSKGSLEGTTPNIERMDPEMGIEKA
ncbi:Ammonium transporter [Lachnellula willkommii]|uniref:Ammonium transporter n=1 Tax=Lachnellula willkommii TaxID=215461 RepID=A0A559ML78_9HELO|nr:Ammonium transporter [Lachnellula willkommii]